MAITQNEQECYDALFQAKELWIARAIRAETELSEIRRRAANQGVVWRQYTNGGSFVANHGGFVHDSETVRGNGITY
jgi:hypothetical protein